MLSLFASGRSADHQMPPRSPSKLAVLCWHLLTKEADYLWARPALVAKKTRDMELASGQPMKKGGKPGSAYAYNLKTLRN
jgi:hypothetical protein